MPLGPRCPHLRRDGRALCGRKLDHEGQHIYNRASTSRSTNNISNNIRDTIRREGINVVTSIEENNEMCPVIHSSRGVQCTKENGHRGNHRWLEEQTRPSRSREVRQRALPTLSLSDTTPIENNENTIIVNGYRRCIDCGQFIGQIAHSCPGHPQSFTASRYSRKTTPNGTRFSYPGGYDLRDGMVANEAILTSITIGRRNIPTIFRNIEGYVRITPQISSTDPDFDAIEDATAWLEERWVNNNNIRSALTQAWASGAGRARQEEIQRVTEEQPYIQARQEEYSHIASTSVSYLDNFDVFNNVYHNVGDIPYLYENATNGLGTRFGGRSFGLELEIDGGNIRNIITELRQASLTTQTRLGSYHRARGHGYNDARNNWSIESDSTVTAEIVSPILYDEPQTWEDLEKVCEIIKRHGGRATDHTGGHIHVGTNGNILAEMYLRVLDTVSAHEDELYRLAQNPDSSSHRGTLWCAPNSDYQEHNNSNNTVSNIRMNNHGHNLAVNFESIHGENGHIEYRLWDGSLNPSVIQTQVNLSLGITDYASRTSGSSIPMFNNRKQLGSSLSRYGTTRLDVERWKDATYGFRRLVDTILVSDKNKEQATALFAKTKWQNNNPGSRRRT